MSEIQELNITSGHPVQFQIEGRFDRHFSPLVGLEKGKYLIIKTPKITGFTNDIYAGLPIIVRYLFQGTVFGFKSRILGQVLSPITLLLLEFPESVESHNLRTHQRCECYIPVHFSLGNGMMPGVLVDVSAGGCRVWVSTEEGEANPSLQSLIEIRFAMEGADNLYKLRGQVRNIKKDGTGTAMGVQFEEERSDLAEFIDSQERKLLNGLGDQPGFPN